MRIAVATAAVCLSLVGLSHAGDVHAAIRKSISIPAQGLASALQALAKERDIQIVYRSEIVGDRRTSGVVGDLTFDEALRQLLEGTGLTFQYLQDNAITILPDASPPRRSEAVAIPASPGSFAGGSGDPVGEARPAARPSFWDRLRLAQLDPARRGTQDPLQNATFGGDQVPERRAQIEEVVVTARKQAESLQKVPVTVTAFTSDAIEKANIQGLQDLIALTPSLNYENIGYRSGNSFTVRGLNSGTSLTQHASMFVDGIYVTGDFSGIPIANLERVEVLKGPQSTVFGRATFAGAMNYITKDPKDVLDGKVSVTMADFDERELNAYLGGPVIDGRLHAMVTAYHMNFGAPKEWRNIRGGHANGSQKTNAASLKLIYTINDDWRVVGRTEYGKDNDGHLIALFITDAQRNFAIVRPNGTIGRYVQGEVPIVPAKAPAFDYNLDKFDEPGVRRQRTRNSISLDGTLGGHAVALTVADNLTREQTQADIDGTPFPGFRRYNRLRDEDTSAELRFTSPQKQRLRYTAGLYWLDAASDVDSVVYRDFSGGAPTFNPVLGKIGNESVFAGVYYDLTPKLTATLEGRYQVDHITTRNPLTNLSFKNDFRSFLPRVNLEYAFTDDVRTYAVYSQGNAPGSFNVGTVLDESQRVVDEENLYNYEIGLKSVWLGGTLLVNAAAYHMEWKDLITNASYFTPQGLPFGVRENRGTAEVDGVEVEVNAILSDGFDVRATFSYNRGRYVDYCSTSLATLFGRSDLPPPNSCINVRGNKLEGQPAAQGSLSFGYRRPLTGDWTLWTRADYSYTGRKYESDMNLAWSPPANVVNARIGVGRGPIEIELFARNVTSEDSMTRVNRLGDPRFGSTAVTNMSIGQVPRRPRQVGLRLMWDF